MQLSLLAIAGVGIALRVLFLGSAQQARFYFSQSTVAAVPYLVEHGGICAWIRKLSLNTHVISSHQSPILLAVHWLFQRTLGASLELVGYVGAAWGTLAIVLAWLAGRATVSSTFGLVFAAFVAVSPLQITWARLGGLPVAAVAHTLLVIVIGTAAGRRRSIWAGALLGIVAFASLYHYYAARVAIPVSVVAVLGGMLSRRDDRRVRAWFVLPVAALVFALLFVAVRQQETFETLWPRYTGYVGTAGERSLIDVAKGAYENARDQLEPTLGRYFLESRDTARRLEAGSGHPIETGSVLRAGSIHGGLSLLPLTVLGTIGLVYCLLHPLRGAVWLAVALGGLLLPLLSLPSARRYLIFDLGWCALAAFGATWIMSFSALSPSLRRIAVATGFVLLTAWSGSTIALLNETLPREPGTPIPFGESGFRDGWTCLRCVDQGRRWASEIEQNAFIVLFDADTERENATSPAGLSLYGRIAAHQAGHSLAFIEFYSVLDDVNRHDDPPEVPRYYDPKTFDAISYLRERVRLAAPERIVWEFRHPTAWEQGLAEALERIGGQRRALLEPPLLNQTLGRRRPQDVPRAFRVATSKAQIDAAFNVVDGFVDPKSQWRKCARLHSVGSRSIDNNALTSLGTLDATKAVDPKTWSVGSYRFGEFGTERLPVWEPLAVVQSKKPSESELRILNRFGEEVTYVGSVQKSRQPMPSATDFGRGCGAFAGSRWWVADGLSGTIQSWPKASFEMPKGRWFGASSRDDALALAGASQEIALVDTRTGQLSARFPARVSPASPNRLGDCSSIALGDRWVAALDPYADRVALYSLRGDPLADLDLADVFPVGPGGVASIAASGHYLGIAHANRLEIVDVSDSCTEPVDSPERAREAQTVPQ